MVPIQNPPQGNGKYCEGQRDLLFGACPERITPAIKIRHRFVATISLGQYVTRDSLWCVISQIRTYHVWANLVVGLEGIRGKLSDLVQPPCLEAVGSRTAWVGRVTRQLVWGHGPGCSWLSLACRRHGRGCHSMNACFGSTRYDPQSYPGIS